jgi:hypothetical protein
MRIYRVRHRTEVPYGTGQTSAVHSANVGAMRSEPEEIKCPRYPDHGMTLKRWLRSDGPDPVKAGDALPRQVFVIDCPVCGQYEHPEERGAK